MTTLMTIPEVMDRLKIGRTLAYRLIRSGELQSVKVGRTRRVSTTALDHFISSRPGDFR
jgi:excisionase family DNA binding protein